jgi:glutamine cyclotransferase
MKHIFQLLIITVFISYISGCNGNNSTNGEDPTLRTSTYGIPKAPVINYSVVGQYPHDTSAFTQGLQLYGDKLYESTGDYENSSIRLTDLKTGSVLQKHVMGSDEIFGEGITILNDTIYQLTWLNNIVYVYTVNDLSKPIKTFQWPYQGWGITNNGTQLIISDGSANLYFVNPSDFRVLNAVRVADHNGIVKNLNELEYINGYVYANIYLSYEIVKIDPESGHVKGRMFFENLLSNAEKTDRTDVLNGIAWDSSRNVLLLTGKRWPKMFEVQMLQ